MLKECATYITYNLVKLPYRASLAEAMEFFIYDTLKIFLLLSVIIFMVSIIRSYFPPERTKNILSHKKEFIGHSGRPLPNIENVKALIKEEA